MHPSNFSNILKTTNSKLTLHNLDIKSHKPFSQMAISSKPFAFRYQTKSISLPSRSHPTTITIEQELNKLKAWEASSISKGKSLCDGLSGLTILYKCLDELLDLPLTQQALFNHQNEKRVDELLEGSIRSLDICGFTRDMMSKIKEHVRDLQCTLRRRKGASCIEECVADYISFRKKIKKDAKKLVADLKQVDHISRTRPPTVEHDHHFTSVIRVFVEVNEMTSSIFESMLFFFASSVSKPKPTRWSLVSKLILKGSEDRELGFPMNELESVDVALLNLCKNGSSNEALEKIEVQIESLDKGLECLFRCLIRTRASLLNILSH